MPKKQYKIIFSELFFWMICQFWIGSNFSFQTSFAMHMTYSYEGIRFIYHFYLSAKLFICKIFHVMALIDFLLSNNKIVVLISVN